MSGGGLGIHIAAFGKLLVSAQHIAKRHDRFEVVWVFLDQRLEVLLCLVRLVERIEIGRHLDGGVAMQRRTRRHALIDLDRQFRLLQRFIKIGEREQGQRMVGRQIERELQIDEREILAAAAAERGADAVQRFAAAGLRARHQQRQFLTGLELLDRLRHQRVTRQHLVEGFEDRQRVFRRLIARGPTAVSFDHPQRRGVELVGMLEAFAGFRLVAGEVVHHAGMQVFEDRVPIRPGELVDRRHGILGAAGRIKAPARQQRRRQIGDRPAHRLRQFAARGGILLVLERAHADHELGDAVVLVGLRDAFGIFDGFIDVAVDQKRQEGAVEQLAVFRVALERVAVEGGGGGGIALLAGMAGGEIAAGRGHAGKLLRGRDLRRQFNWQSSQKCGKRGADRAPGEARRSHWQRSNKAARKISRKAAEGWAENGLFAPHSQLRRSRTPVNRIKPPRCRQYRGRVQSPSITYSGSSARHRLRAEPR